VVDAPVVYEDEEQEKIWKPENYEKKFHGVITLREALMHSRNLATVKLLDRIGIRSVIEFARTIGISSPLNYDLSLALGSSGLTPLEMTSAYGVFANQGIRLEPYAIALVQDSNGQMLEQTLFEPRQVISKEVAYLITNIMEDVIQRGTGQLAKTIQRPVAGKTGTTNDYTDAWFIGYTPSLAVGVWVGFDDLRSLGETESGAHAALPIWIDFMVPVLENQPVLPFEIPDDIVFVQVDPTTGLLAQDHSDGGSVEMFAKGTEPTQSAPPRLDPAEFYRLDETLEPASAGPGASR
jgi:penicillin-binding protein 1A